MEIVTLPVGPFEANCYLARPPKSDTLYIIDPGAEPRRIIEEAKKFNASRTVVLLTHAHIDHISALAEITAALHPEAVWLDSDDLKLYHSPLNAIEPYYPPAENLPETTDDLPGEPIKILRLPGHSQGGTGFYFPAEKVLFTGDSIFAGSIGRTDLPGGNFETLIKSLKEVVLTLPPDTRIYPGHGPSTTAGYEKATNPFLQ